MRLTATFIALLATVSLAACGSSTSTTTTTTDSASSAPATAGAATTAPGAGSATTGVPVYPGATTMASGSHMTGGSMGAASGTVYTTADAFDKVEAFYKAKLPAGSEKAHTMLKTGDTAVFYTGTAGDMTSLTISQVAGKTMITEGHVKQH